MPPVHRSHQERWKITKPLRDRIRASRIRPAGLPTDGYHCYQNVVIQAFCHIPKLVDWLQQPRPRLRRSPKSPDSLGMWPIRFGALTRAFWNTRLSRAEREEQVALQLDRWRDFLKKTLGADFPFLQGELQQDIKDYRGVFARCFASTPKNKQKNTATQLLALFSIGLREISECQSCGRKKQGRGAGEGVGLCWSLEVDVPRPGFGPLTQCFESDLNGPSHRSLCECADTESSDKDDDGNVKHVYRRRLIFAPRVFILQLTVAHPVEDTEAMNPESLVYPETLDLTDFVDEEHREEIGTLRYRLNSVIGHEEEVVDPDDPLPTGIRGHYKIRTRGPGGVFEISDMDVTELTSAEDLLTMDGDFKPMMLFYLAEEDFGDPNPIGTIEPTQSGRVERVQVDHPRSLVLSKRTRSGRV